MNPSPRILHVAILGNGDIFLEFAQVGDLFALLSHLRQETERSPTLQIHIYSDNYYMVGKLVYLTQCPDFPITHLKLLPMNRYPVPI